MSLIYGASDSEHVLSNWLQHNSYHHRDYSSHTMATAKRSMHVIVIIPAREVAQTIKGVLEKAVGPMIQAGIIDEVFVIDHDSKDGTGLIASACGAKVDLVTSYKCPSRPNPY